MKKIYIVLFLLCTLTSQAQITINPLGLGVTPTTKIGRGAVNRLFTDTIDNLLYAVGGFSSMGGINCYGVAKWDGQTWDSVGSGIRESFIWDQIQNVEDVIRFKNNIYICGAFYKCGGKDIFGIARWNGTQWDSVGTRMRFFNEGNYSYPSVKDMEVINNELYVVGNFTSIGNVITIGVAKWDGQNWTDLSQGIINPYPVNTYLSLMFYNNELYLAGIGSIGLLKRVGNTWQKIGAGVKGDAWVNRLEVYQNNLYVAGYFQTPAGNIDNSLFYTNGTSYFGTAGGVLPSNLLDIQEYKTELYACGQFNYAGFQPVDRIAKWNGTQWFNTNLSIQIPENNIPGTAYAMEVYDGKLIIAGGFSAINGVQTWNIGSVDFGNAGVGISNLSQNGAVKLFPNPAQTQVRIELDKNAKLQEIRLFNAIGQLVLQQNATTENILDVSKLAKGMYVVHVQSDKGILREKLMVE